VVYEAEVLQPFRELILAVAATLGQGGLPLVGDPKQAIFRIYRDIRFSPDKRPYKTHAGAVLTRSGSKRNPGVLYLHVAPGASMGRGRVLASAARSPDPVAARHPRRRREFPRHGRPAGRGRSPDFQRRAEFQRLCQPQAGLWAPRGRAQTSVDTRSGMRWHIAVVSSRPTAFMNGG
jgi:hypothetical protein